MNSNITLFPLFSIHKVILLLVIILLGGSQAGILYASMTSEVSLNSNLLFMDGKVIFIQSTGSLTALDLQTGKVLLRKQPPENFYYDGTLRQCPYGVLIINYQTVDLLDGKTFEPIWHIEGSYHKSVDSQKIVSTDNDSQRVQCHDLKTGKLCWTAPMCGCEASVITKGRALVSTGPYYEKDSAFKLFDLETGHELLSKTAPADVHWWRVYSDGEYIYLLTIDADKKDKYPQIPESITKLNMRGEQVETIPFSSSRVVSASEVYYLDDKCLQADGSVRDIYPNEIKELIDGINKDNSFIRCLPSGCLSQIETKDSSGELGIVLQMKSEHDSWQIYLPNIKSCYNNFFHFPEYDGKLLLNYDLGQIECIDVKTGKPQWVYIFPTVRFVVSCSYPYGMPPYVESLAKAYREKVENLNKAVSGCLLLPVGFDAGKGKWRDLRNSMKYEGNIIIDPSPDDPFPELPRYRAWLAFFTLTPIVGMFVFVLITLIRWRLKAVGKLSISPKAASDYLFFITSWTVFFSCLPLFGLVQLGRVSHSWTLSLKIVYVLLTLIATCGVVRLYIQRRWIIGLLLTFLILFLFFIVKDMLRYA